MTPSETYKRVQIKSAEPWHAWILSDHYEALPSTSGRKRTHLGELLYRVKYSGDRKALAALKLEVGESLLQLGSFPTGTDGLAGVTAVAAVPCNPPKELSVPHELAATAASVLGVPDFSPVVVKVRTTHNAKREVPRLHLDAYTVRRRLDGEHMLLVDDLFHTGTTLESVAANLRSSGAAHVVGLCVTQAHRGMTP